MNFIRFEHLRSIFIKLTLILCIFLASGFTGISYGSEVAAIEARAAEASHTEAAASKIGHTESVVAAEEGHTSAVAAAEVSDSSEADTYGTAEGVADKDVDTTSTNCGRASLFSSKDCDESEKPGMLSKIGSGIGSVVSGAGKLLGGAMSLLGSGMGALGNKGGGAGGGASGGGAGGMNGGGMNGGMGGASGGGMNGGMGGSGSGGGTSGGNGVNNSSGSNSPQGGQSGGNSGSNGQNSNGQNSGGFSGGQQGMGQGGFPGGQQGMGQGGFPGGGQQGMGQGGYPGGGQQGMGQGGMSGGGNGLTPAQQALANAGFAPQTLTTPAQQIGTPDAINLAAASKAAGIDGKKPVLKTVDSVFGDVAETDTTPFMKNGWFGDNPEGARGNFEAVKDGFQETTRSVRDNMQVSTPETLTN